MKGYVANRAYRFLVINGVLAKGPLPSLLETMLSKRQMFANVFTWTGCSRVLELLPSRPGVLVVNYHRIGNKSACEFDRGVFTASVAEFEQQVAVLKRRFPVIGLEETIQLLQKPSRMKRLHVLLTFDDGYLDNYELARPVLYANACPAVFFVVPQFVGTAKVSWWDEVAFLVLNSRNPVLELSYPVQKRIELGANRETAIETVLRIIRSPEVEPDRFLAALKEATKVEPRTQSRRFMNWSEIRELAGNGMEIGSHTVSHAILSRLSSEEQLRELMESKAMIEGQIGRVVRAFAYPVGDRVTFTPATEALVRQCGYEVAFSFYGGLNTPANWRNTDIRRQSMAAEPNLFRMEAVLMSRFGRLPF